MKKINLNVILVYLCLFLTVLLWFIFANLFSIFSYIESIYFALDKVSGHFFSLPIQLTLFIFIFLLFAYGMITHLITRMQHISSSLLVILVFSIFLSGLFAVFIYPVGALDLFNYVLMGKLVVFYGQNPFLIPFDAVAYQDSLQKYAIFLQVTTGYGPWWVLITSLVAFISGTTSLLSMVLSYKIMTLLFYFVTAVLLYYLPEKKNDRILAASLYLLNPFIIFDGIVNAHNDILVSFFIVLALIALRRKHIAVFVCVILAALIKLYAIVLLPLFFLMMLQEKWSKKEIGYALIAGGICFVLLYLPFWGDGKLINGIIEGLVNAQVINGFSPYSLTREFLSNSPSLISLIPFIQLFFAGIFLFIFLLVIRYTLKTKEYLCGAICLLLTFFLCMTIYQPWYVIPVLALLTLSQKRKDQIFSFLISTGALLSYPASVWAWFHSGWSVFSIHIFLACFVALPSLLYVFVLLSEVIAAHNKVQD